MSGHQKRLEHRKPEGVPTRLTIAATIAGAVGAVAGLIPLFYEGTIPLRLLWIAAIIFLIALLIFFFTRRQPGMGYVGSKRARGEFVYSARTRYVTLIATVTIIVAPIIGLRISAARDARMIRIVIADFYGPMPSKYQVTEQLYDDMKEAAKGFPNLEVRRVTRGRHLTVRDSEEARVVVKEEKASILIWGRYSLPGDRVHLSAHFEPFQADSLIGVTREAEGSDLSFPRQSLNDTTLHTMLSHSAAHLCLFAAGLVRLGNDPAGAISYFDRAIAYWPSIQFLDNGMAYFLRGVARYMTGESDKALEDLTMAVKLQPDFAVGQLIRGLYYANQTGDANGALLNLNEALKRPKALEARGMLPTAYAVRGFLYEDLGMHAKALRDLNQSLSLKSDIIEAYAYRGLAYLGLNQSDKAIHDFSQVINRSDYAPRRGQAYDGRALSYLTRKEYANALSDVNKAIDLEQNATRYLLRAVTYLAMRDPQRAEQDLSRSKALDSKSETALLAGAVTSLLRGNERAALRELGHIHLSARSHQLVALARVVGDLASTR